MASSNDPRYTQVWEGQYGYRETFIEAANRINDQIPSDALTGFAIYWSDLIYDLRLFAYIAYQPTDPKAEEYMLLAENLMVSAGAWRRSDLTGDVLDRACLKRQLNLVSAVQGISIEIDFDQPSRADLEAQGFTIERWDVPKSKTFLSHQGDRKGEVAKLQMLLADGGVATWFDALDIEYGDSLVAAIEDGVSESTAVVFWISPGFSGSHWCQYEFEAFLSRYAGRRDVRILTVVEEGLSGSLPEALKRLKYVETGCPGSPEQVAAKLLPVLRR
jgi:hypothetical protein